MDASFNNDKTFATTGVTSLTIDELAARGLEQPLSSTSLAVQLDLIRGYLASTYSKGTIGT